MRSYICVKHVGCKFFANFGSRGMDKAIVLKRYCLEHQGITREPLAIVGKKEGRTGWNQV
jgi:hypothetical protein